MKDDPELLKIILNDDTKHLLWEKNSLNELPIILAKKSGNEKIMKIFEKKMKWIWKPEKPKRKFKSFSWLNNNIYKFKKRYKDTPGKKRYKDTPGKKKIRRKC